MLEGGRVVEKDENEKNNGEKRAENNVEMREAWLLGGATRT